MYVSITLLARELLDIVGEYKANTWGMNDINNIHEYSNILYVYWLLCFK